VSQIEGIIFDFGGVFTRSDETNARLAEYDALLGLAPGALQNMLYSGAVWEMASTGQISPAEHWERTGKRYEDALPADFRRLGEGLFLYERIDEQVVQVAAQLHRLYPMALCSNALDDLDKVLALRPDIRRLFDVIVVSSEVGLRKPDPAILYLTAQRLCLPPNRCVLIDDKTRNTDAAIAAGMPALTFRSPAQLLHDLQERGLLQPQAQ